ncbi:MAG: S1 RNA-binding domain-containing protein, partial [Selenomonadales bacterium]|nr:S1 RNA-binding domain-containing protein [Selenomonadales bacterium]
MSEEITMESWLAAEENNEGLQVNDVVTATVEAVSDNEATVHIDGHKNDIPVPKKELAYPEPEKASDIVKVGDEIEVVVVSLGGEYG